MGLELGLPVSPPHTPLLPFPFLSSLVLAQLLLSFQSPALQTSPPTSSLKSVLPPNPHPGSQARTHGTATHGSSLISSVSKILLPEGGAHGSPCSGFAPFPRLCEAVSRSEMDSRRGKCPIPRSEMIACLFFCAGEEGEGEGSGGRGLSWQTPPKGLDSQNLIGSGLWKHLVVLAVHKCPQDFCEVP